MVPSRVANRPGGVAHSSQLGAPGFVAALAYFVLVRPKLKVGTPVV